MIDFSFPFIWRLRRVVEVEIGDAIPRRGNRVTQAIAIFLLWLAGWRMEGEIPDEPKMVAIGAPHTSNWDMLLGMVGMYAVRLRIAWMVKHTAFRWPLVRLLRWLGGVPIDRRGPQGTVGSMVETFRRRDKLILVILPEGTRRPVQRWKTGFYHIANGADAPILLVKFDYGRKSVRFGPTVRPTGNADADIRALQAEYWDVRGKFPQPPAGLVDSEEARSKTAEMGR